MSHQKDIIRKAVFPVAGLGMRFLPVTKALPKEMLPVLNKPLVQYAVEEAFEAGITEILFVNGRGKNALEDYFDRQVEIETILKQQGKTEAIEELQSIIGKEGTKAFVRQVVPKGLGHAVSCAKSWVQNEPFMVVLPDDFVQASPGCLSQMKDVYNLSMGNLVALEDVPLADVSHYGIVGPAVSSGDALISIRNVVEKPKPENAPSTLGIIGRYILHPDVFKVLETQAPGHGGEIQLTDTLALMIPTHGLSGVTFNGNRFDCGNVAGMVAAQIAQAQNDPQLWAKVLTYLERGKVSLL